MINGDQNYVIATTPMHIHGKLPDVWTAHYYGPNPPCDMVRRIRREHRYERIHVFPEAQWESLPIGEHADDYRVDRGKRIRLNARTPIRSSHMADH